MRNSQAIFFSTENFDFASYLSATGHGARICYSRCCTISTFTFDGTKDLYAAFLDNEMGVAHPAKRLFNRHYWLFCETSRADQVRIYGQRR